MASIDEILQQVTQVRGQDDPKKSPGQVKAGQQVSDLIQSGGFNPAAALDSPTSFTQGTLNRQDAFVLLDRLGVPREAFAEILTAEQGANLTEARVRELAAPFLPTPVAPVSVFGDGIRSNTSRRDSILEELKREAGGNSGR